MNTSIKAKILSMLGLVFLADFLFYSHAIGWTIGGFGFLMVGIFCIYHLDLLKSHFAKLLLVLTLGQCFLQIEKQSLLSFTLMMLGLISLALLRRDNWKNDAAIWLRLCLSFVIRFMHPLNKLRIGYQRYLQKHTSESVFSTFIRGWFLPVILSLTFLYLFSKANPVMMNWFDGIDLTRLFLGLQIKRIIFWFVIACLTLAIIRPRIKYHIRSQENSVSIRQQQSFTDWAFSKDAVLRSLVVFNLIFALQTMMDMNYLWAGSALPEGISYANYAHKGAYPLIVTALLAAIFVLITQDDKKDILKSKLITNLTYLWIIQNLLLVFSSIYRTFLYVEIYALTYLRVAAFIWMGLVACGLIWIILRSFFCKSNTWLINANILTLLTVLYVASFVNIGGVIAHYNVSHSKEVSGLGVRLDIYYLKRIGAVSIPAISKLEQYNPALNNMKCNLKRKMDNWRRWTYSEYRLLILFNDCKAKEKIE